MQSPKKLKLNDMRNTENLKSKHIFFFPFNHGVLFLPSLCLNETFLTSYQLNIKKFKRKNTRFIKNAFLKKGFTNFDIIKLLSRRKTQYNIVKKKSFKRFSQFFNIYRRLNLKIFQRQLQPGVVACNSNPALLEPEFWNVGDLIQV